MFVPEWLSEFAREVGGQIVMSNNAGGTIKEYRKRYGITQKQMSHLLGLRRETISRIENSRSKPTFEFLQSFTRIIAISEAIRVQRARQREIEFPYIERLSKELGIRGDDLRMIVGIALEDYDRKQKRVVKLLR